MKIRQATDEDFLATELLLKEDGWSYDGCDIWIDHQTGLKHGIVNAYEINLQRTGHTI